MLVLAFWLAPRRRRRTRQARGTRCHHRQALAAPGSRTGSGELRPGEGSRNSNARRGSGPCGILFVLSPSREDHGLSRLLAGDGKLKVHLEGRSENGTKAQTELIRACTGRNLTAEVWVELAVAAVATETLLLGPGVTNPATRDLSVTASRRRDAAGGERRAGGAGVRPR